VRILLQGKVTYLKAKSPAVSSCSSNMGHVKTDPFRVYRQRNLQQQDEAEEQQTVKDMKWSGHGLHQVFPRYLTVRN
jgi:hypothetical protein